MLTGSDWSSQLAVLWPLGCCKVVILLNTMGHTYTDPFLQISSRAQSTADHQFSHCAKSLQLGKVKGCTWLQIDLDHVHSVQICATTHRVLNCSARTTAPHTWCRDEHGLKSGGCWPASLHHTHALSFCYTLAFHTESDVNFSWQLCNVWALHVQ